MSLYRHVPHPHIARRRTTGPVTTSGERTGINGRIGLAITTLVGTMICGYVFAVIALLSLPSAISSHNLTVIIAWISSNFLQLVLLPVIIVGQNIQARASDKRAEQTYQDAEAVLHEALQIQEHLAAQDAVLTQLADSLAGAVQAVMAARGEHDDAVAADAKAARQSAEAAFAGVQALAAVATGKPGPGELAAAVATNTEAVREMHHLLATAVKSGSEGDAP